MHGRRLVHRTFGSSCLTRKNQVRRPGPPLLSAFGARLETESRRPVQVERGQALECQERGCPPAAQPEAAAAAAAAASEKGSSSALICYGIDPSHHRVLSLLPPCTAVGRPAGPHLPSGGPSHNTSHVRIPLPRTVRYIRCSISVDYRAASPSCGLHSLQHTTSTTSTSGLPLAQETLPANGGASAWLSSRGRGVWSPRRLWWSWSWTVVLLEARWSMLRSECRGPIGDGRPEPRCLTRW
jgi:hypothetical protein